jgi:hypothetical protein
VCLPLARGARRTAAPPLKSHGASVTPRVTVLRARNGRGNPCG